MGIMRLINGAPNAQGRDLLGAAFQYQCARPSWGTALEPRAAYLSPKRANMRTPLLVAASLAASLACFAQPPVSIQLQLVNGGRTEPVAIANAGDDRLFVVERGGLVYILNANGTWAAQPFLDISDRVNDGGGEQGLLGIAFHPNYANNGYFYVHYTGGTGIGNSRISRFSVSANPNDALETSEFFVWSVVQPGPNLNHRGGDIHFGPDGHLYFALGDAGGIGDPGNYAQGLTQPFGKILRINVDGTQPYSVPASNPYVGAGGGTLPEIWAHGLRNPWRFSIDEPTGDVWIGDVGQGAFEEINRWPGGNNTGPNFGWRCYEGTAAYNTAGCTGQGTYDGPVVEHGQPAGWCAIVGGHVYRGQNFPRLSGRYIYVDWCLGSFRSLEPNGGGGWVQDTLLDSGVFGFAAIGETASGELYVCNQNNGNVYRLADPYSTVRLSARVFLEGPYNSGTDDMSDALRLAGLVPTTEPYTALDFPQRGWSGETVTTGALAVTGPNAIVDWVHLELRQSGAPANIVATAHGLVQRDGDIVAGDGTSPVVFTALPGNYHVAVRHRNHLGAMTSAALALSATTTVVDLRVAATTTFGTNARKTVGTRRVLWTGNVVRDTQLKYTGSNNDRDPILTAVGGTIPTNTVTGYRPEDCNLDGVVRYTGTANDRDPILVNIGGSVPTSTLTEQLP